MTKVMAVGKYLQPDEEFVISDLETIHIVSEPLRLQILEILKETPKTVKMVAKELGINQVKLYYHFKLLEEHGLLRITEERMVSHLIEKVYQTRARSIRIATDLLTSEKSVSESSETLLAYVFDKARAKLRRDFRRAGSATILPPTRATASPPCAAPCAWLLIKPPLSSPASKRSARISSPCESSPPSGGDWYDCVVAMYPVRLSTPTQPGSEEKA